MDTTETFETTETITYIAKPEDAKCKWWCKVWNPTTYTETAIARDGLPLVGGANALPGDYVRRNADLELRPWAVVFDGEALDPRRTYGWRFSVGFALPPRFSAGGDPMEAEVCFLAPTAARKAYIKAAPDGGAPYMAGSGEHAAMLRIACYILAGAYDAERIARYRAVQSAVSA